MKNWKKALSMTAALALSVSMLAGCGADGSASSGSASGSAAGSASASSSAEQAAPAPGAQDSDGMGRRYADLVGMYLMQSGTAAGVPDATVKAGNDQEIGPHLQQTYAVTSTVTMVVYTDQADQHLLRLSVQTKSVANETDLKISRYIMEFVPIFFDADEAGRIQQELHLTDAAAGKSYASKGLSGSYQFTKTDKGSNFDYRAN